MNHFPLVTIVVISYNQSQYINENLDSIKNQTYPNIQLIVADDASKDNSVEKFNLWLKNNDFQAHTNFHQKNTGLATVLNECIELASGKYIKMIAADDFLHPESIEKCVQKLEILGDEYGMVFTDTYVIDVNSEIISDVADYNTLGNVSPEYFRESLIKGNRIAALSVLLRLDVLKETGKYDSNFLVEDYYRWLLVNEKYYIGYIAEKLAYYRMHDTNISISKREQIKREDILLKLIFDKKGSVKKNINYYLFTQYLNNRKIDKKLLEAFLKYPYKSKRLAILLRLHIPAEFYKKVSKFI